jgi:N-acetylglutamate synthase
MSVEKHSCIKAVVIRAMKIDDYDQVVQLWHSAGLPFKPHGRDSREKIAIELEQPMSLFFVAELEQRLIGVVFGTHDGRKGWINRVAVHPEFQRLGIAQKLVTTVENSFLERGIEIFACLVESWNEISMKCVAAGGYRRHDDVVYFTKRLSPNS